MLFESEGLSGCTRLIAHSEVGGSCRLIYWTLDRSAHPTYNFVTTLPQPFFCDPQRQTVIWPRASNQSRRVKSSLWPEEPVDDVPWSDEEIDLLWWINRELHDPTQRDVYNLIFRQHFSRTSESLGQWLRIFDLIGV